MGEPLHAIEVWNYWLGDTFSSKDVYGNEINVYNFHVDYCIPREIGGNDTFENLQPIHAGMKDGLGVQIWGRRVMIGFGLVYDVLQNLQYSDIKVRCRSKGVAIRLYQLLQLCKKGVITPDKANDWALSLARRNSRAKREMAKSWEWAKRTGVVSDPND